jgi:FkbM family methyltransferase
LISYSQNAEDVRLWRVLHDVPGGTYVDVGAHLPASGSVTKLMYDAGWSGINIEPGPSFALLASERPRDINLNVAVGEKPGSTTLWLTHPHDGMATVDPSFHDHVGRVIEAYEPIAVRVARLDQLIAEHAPDRDIHFLKVDVEGAEASVLRSNDWAQFRPWILVIEAVRTLDSLPTHDTWEPDVIAAGYQLATFDGLNRLYVANEHVNLLDGLAYPTGVLDNYVTATQLDLERERLDLQAERDALQDELASIRSSRTWRAMQVIAHWNSRLGRMIR